MTGYVNTGYSVDGYAATASDVGLYMDAGYVADGYADGSFSVGNYVSSGYVSTGYVAGLSTQITGNSKRIIVGSANSRTASAAGSLNRKVSSDY